MPSGRIFAGNKDKLSVTGNLSVTGGSVVQYINAETAIGAAGTGVFILGLNSTTARGVKVDTDGTVFVTGGGGGTQYPIGNTALGSTGTGTIAIGIQQGATTARGLLLTTTGGLAHLATVSTLLGTVSISGTVDGTFGGGVQYINAETAIGATGTGTLFIGVQSGATTSRAIVVTTTGAQHTFIVGTPAVTAANVTIASITTGTVNVATGLLNISGTVPVTLASLATVSTLLGTVAISGSMSVINTPTITIGNTANFILVSGTVSTVLAMPVLSATNVTIASIATGTVSVINTPTVTIGGTASAFLLAGTAGVGGVRIIAHQSRFQSYVVATTSAAAGIIIQTSGAHTLYITDYLVSVDGPMQVDLCSETTALVTMYLATKGGAVANMINPLVCSSAKSFIVVCGSSGKCAVACQGYTVT
jgi:hypothetical protein